MKFYVAVCVSVLLVFHIIKPIESSKILVVAPFFGKSHAIFVHSIVSELATRNHDIVLITCNLIKDAPPNLRQIEVENDSHTQFTPTDMFKKMNIPIVFQAAFIWGHILEQTENYLKNPNVQEFLAEKEQHFDLVISELFYLEPFYMLAHKYKSPLALLGSSTFFQAVEDFMGHEPTLSYLSNEYTKHYGDLTSYQRLVNFFVGNFIKLGNNYFMKKKQQALAEKYFSDLPKPLPNIVDIEKNISLVLMNTHFSYDNVRPLVPGVVEIGGVHIKKPKPLPKKIQKFLDEANDGAIYFSLGSFLKSSEMPQETKNIFFKVFKELKQRILWKWEDENLPTDLTNVLVSKWMPQSDILAHPNIRLFISHGGMLGSQETIHRGVPILGIPVYGDQPLNMARMSAKEIGLQLSFDELTEEKLRNAINEILTNPKYAKNAKTLSQRYHDQLNTPMEKAMYWIEYVIRHKGADFMKSKLVHLPWYKHYFLDIYLILSIIAIALHLILSKTLNVSLLLCIWIVLKFTVSLYALYNVSSMIYNFLYRT